jgi:hypothetical protein
MWSIELAEGACTPKVELMVLGKASRESASPHFHYLSEGKFGEEDWYIGAS